jgi:uncharacterized protein (DUF1330 family)
MITQIKAVLALMIGIVIGSFGLGALHAQTKSPAAYWVTEVLEMSDQAPFIKAIQAVPPTLQPFGGRYIVLGGKIAPDHGPPPNRITIVAFDSLEKAQQWISDSTAVAARAEVNKYAKTRSYAVEGVAN